MNKELNQNTRTLIVSFVLALMVMIPLRFVEVGNLGGVSQSVLGESVELVESNGECLSDNEVDDAVATITNEVLVGTDETELQDKLDEIVVYQSRRCQ